MASAKGVENYGLGYTLHIWIPGTLGIESMREEADELHLNILDSRAILRVDIGFYMGVTLGFVSLWLTRYLDCLACVLTECSVSVPAGSAREGAQARTSAGLERTACVSHSV